jgi:hypothetical protein
MVGVMVLAWREGVLAGQPGLEHGNGDALRVTKECQIGP